MSETYYEVIAENPRGRAVIASDLTDKESDDTRRQYINRHGLNAKINGVWQPAHINIYRQRHEHKEFVEDYEEVIPQ